MRWKGLKAEMKATQTRRKKKILKIYIKQRSKMGMQAILVHKYIVYNKTLRYTYSLCYGDSLNRTALMNHRQIKEL